MNKPVEVILSFDIEFDINGALSNYPDEMKPIGLPSLMREAKGNSHGLGFILNALSAFGLKGTFFIETLNAHYFGANEMSSAARQIAKRGHDLQLHIHPCWRYFRDPDWRSKVKGIQKNDSMAGRSVEETEELIGDAKCLFEEMTKCSPVALRTGNLEIDRAVYQVMRELGITISSSIGLGFWGPSDPSLRLNSGLWRVEEVIEIPVTSYRGSALLPRNELRLLTVPGTSFPEIVTLLEAARKVGMSPVVLLGHASDFCELKDWRTNPRYVPNRINQGRFKRTCQYLTKRRDLFRVVTFGEMADTWCGERENKAKDILLQSSFYGSLRRIIENAVLPRLGIQ